jgi:hypothetical protein
VQLKRERWLRLPVLNLGDHSRPVRIAHERRLLADY